MTAKGAESVSGIAVLAESNPSWEDGPFPVRGVALPEDITTHGNARNEDVYWPPEVVESAVDDFQGAKITDPSEHDPETAMENPQPSPDTILGEITTARYEPGTGIVYKGEIDDPEFAKRVERGRVEVSPTLFRTLGNSEVNGARPVEEVVGVRDLSIVAEGMADGNKIAPATAAMSALSASALRQGLAEALQETKTVAGVTFRDTRDGQLDESEIPNDDFESHYLYPADTKSESGYPVVDADGFLRRGNVDAAWSLGARGRASEDEHDSSLMELAAEFENPPEWAESMAELSNLSDGDLVRWNSSGDRDAYGEVVDTISEGQFDSEISGDVSVDAPAALIQVHQPGEDGWEETETMVAHKPDTLSKIDSLPDPESLAKHDDKGASSMEGVPEEFKFDNPGGAMDKADEMGFNEIHSHGEGEDTIFMPGPTHEELVSELEDMGEMDSSETMGAESPADDTQSDDGTHGVWSQSSVAASGTSENMTDLSDKETSVLEAAESLENPVEVLEEYAATEQATIAEEDRIESMEARLGEFESVVDDRLEEQTGLSEETVEAMSLEAKIREFEDEDGNLEAESLIQQPETETPDEDVTDEPDEAVEALVEDVGASDKDEAVETLEARYQRYKRAGWDTQAEEVANQLDTLGTEV